MENNKVDVKNFLSLKNLDSELWEKLLRASNEVKHHPGNFRQMITGKSSVLVFEKSSINRPIGNKNRIK